MAVVLDVTLRRGFIRLFKSIHSPIGECCGDANSQSSVRLSKNDVRQWHLTNVLSAPANVRFSGVKRTLRCRMVETMQDARLSIPLTQHSNRVSTNTGLRRRETRFCAAETKASKGPVGSGLCARKWNCRDEGSESGNLHRQSAHARNADTSGTSLAEKFPWLNAQELPADNRLVVSSSPPSPTTQSCANGDFPVQCESPRIGGDLCTHFISATQPL
jgi:hypothetical protein